MTCVDGDSESHSVTVTKQLPTVVGAPVRSSVFESTVGPGGMPEALQGYGAVPSADVNVKPVKPA